MSAVDPILLPGKYTGEDVVVSCNFAKRLGLNVGLNSCSVVATVHEGVDGNPSAILSGAASIVGTRVLQFVIDGVSGVTYSLLFSATTDEATPQILQEELLLAVE